MTETRTSIFTRKTFQAQPARFRIEAIISDGMWYSIPKWRNLAKVTEEELRDWIDEALDKGKLIQSETGAKSYRLPLEEIYAWYGKHGFSLEEQLLDFLFPPRIWDGKTEVEGFLEAPLREIGVVSFSSNNSVAEKITDALRGIARVREFEPGRYKAYSLSSTIVRDIVKDIIADHRESEAESRVSPRSAAKRRELVDFSPTFADGLVEFYRNFAKSLVKSKMDTIRIYLPDPEDQESQITIWVLTAIEKFDESSAVPFSGYFNSSLQYWPYDLPAMHLGKELSSFQRSRSKAINALRAELGDDVENFTNQQIAEVIGMDIIKYNDLEERHKVWMRTRTATTLNWDESTDEKLIKTNLAGDLADRSGETDIELAHKLSVAIVKTALKTQKFDCAFALMSQVDAPELSIETIQSVDEDFITELGLNMGLGN